MGGLPHGREQQLTLAGQLTTYQPLNVGNRDGDDVGGMRTGQPLDVAWILAVAASSTDRHWGRQPSSRHSPQPTLLPWPPHAQTPP